MLISYFLVRRGEAGGDALFLPIIAFFLYFNLKTNLKSCGHIASLADFYYHFMSFIRCCPLVYQHDLHTSEAQAISS